MVDDSITEDELLAASLFFTSRSEEAVRVVQTFLSLNSNWVIQRRFLLSLLDKAGLLSGKGKQKEDDNSMDC